MRALVTGGAGFIGSNLSDLLLAKGHDVVVLDDLSSGYRQNVPEGVELHLGNVSNPDAVRTAANRCEVIFHLAASVGNTRSIEDPLHDSEVNLLGTLAVLEAARSAGIERVVLSSSAGIFGELKTIPIQEDHPTDPDSPYGVSKLAAEKMCLAYNKLHGMKNVCLRYFNVYGPRQRFDAYGNVIPIFGERLLQGEPIHIYGDGEQTRDFVNVRDVIQANYLAGTHATASGAYNTGSGSRVTINHLAHMMGEIAHREARIVHVAARPGDVRDSLACVEHARDEFGFEPEVGLKAGLVEYLDWLSTDQVTLDRWSAGTI